ncbi:MAG: MFS transporter [Planctomycetota bacterium]
MSALFRAYLRAYEGLPAATWTLAGVMFVSRCGTMFLPFLAIFLRSQQDYSAFEAGKMLAVYGLGAVIGTYLGGQLVARVGAIPVMVGSLTLGAPGFLALPYCESPRSLVAVLLYLSVVREAVRPALATATSDYSPPEMHSKAFALNRLALNLGISIGAAVSGLLAAWGYAWLFGFNAVVGIVSAAMAVYAFGWRPPPTHLGAKHAVAPVTAGPWRDAPFLAFLALQLIAGLVFSQLIGAMPMFWEKECGIDERGIGLLFVVNTLMVVTLEMLVTDRLRGRSPLPIVAVGSGLVALGFGGSALQGWAAPGGYVLSGWSLACGLVVVWTAGEILSAPFSMAFVAGRSAGPTRPLYMGMNAASLSASNVAAPLVGGWLYQQNPWLPWWCCLAMAAALPAGYLALNAADRRHRSAAEHRLENGLGVPAPRAAGNEASQ